MYMLLWTHRDMLTLLEIRRAEFNKNYYIDATTGEIIGGEETEYSFE